MSDLRRLPSGAVIDVGSIVYATHTDETRVWLAGDSEPLTFDVDNLDGIAIREWAASLPLLVQRIPSPTFDANDLGNLAVKESQ